MRLNRGQVAHTLEWFRVAASQCALDPKARALFVDAIKPVQQIVGDLRDLWNVLDAARDLLLVLPTPDAAKEPKLAAAVNRLWATIEMCVVRRLPSAPPEHKEMNDRV